MLDKAIAIAVKAHEGQKDKAGETYILHPLRLMLQMRTQNERIVAVLHDVPEDSAYKIKQLTEAGFTGEITDALECLCKKEDEAYQTYIERLRRNPIARKVKLADLQDNMNILRMKTLTEVDVERIKKYHAAWLYLSAAG